MEPAHAAPIAIALLGLLLGMRHATDADHVIAVSTIVTQERRLGAAARIGMCWGIGHTFTIVLVGLAIIVFKVAIPPRLGLAMEFAVAVVLMLLGISAVSGLLKRLAARYFGAEAPAPQIIVHAHEHSHGDLLFHHHPHAHFGTSPETHRDHSVPPAAAQGLAIANLDLRFPKSKALGVGLVHGLAGSAAIALLVLGAIPYPLWAILYLGVFGVGTVVGMVIITTAIGCRL